VNDDAVGLGGVARPVHHRTGCGCIGLERLQMLIQVAQGAVLDRLGRQPQLLPVVEFVDDFRTLGPDDAGGVRQVAALAGVRQFGAGSDRELGHPDKRRRHADMGMPGMAAADTSGHAGSFSVEARISARCIVRTPDLSRDNSPPICARHELSPATSTSAFVSRTWRALSEPIATDTSAFFIAKVPPNPQHSSAAGNSTRSIPRTWRSNRN